MKPTIWVATSLVLLLPAILAESGPNLEIATTDNPTNYNESSDTRTTQRISTKKSDKKKQKRTCNFMQLSGGQFKVLPNRTVRITDGELELLSPNFTLHHPENRSVFVEGWEALEKIDTKDWNRYILNVCYPLSEEFLNCKTKWGLYPREYDLLPGKRLHNKAHDETLQPDEFYFNDKALAVVCKSSNITECHIGSDPYHVHLIMYIVSVCFLLLTVAIHILLPSINYDAKPLLCHMLSMTALFVSLTAVKLLNQRRYTAPVLCYGCFISIQYFGLSMFLWLNVLAFDLWLKLTGMRPSGGDCRRTSAMGQVMSQRLRLYAIYANGIPLLFVIAAIIVATSDKIQQGLGLHMELHVRCWYNDHLSASIFFFGPSMVAHVMNLIFFVGTVVSLCRHVNQNPRASSSLHKKLFIIFAKLFIVMGVFWIFETVSYYFPGSDCSSPWFIPDLINAMQGIFMFIIYIVRPSAWQKLKERFPWLSKVKSPCTMSMTSNHSTITQCSNDKRPAQAAATLQATKTVQDSKKEGLERPILLPTLSQQQMNAT